MVVGAGRCCGRNGVGRDRRRPKRIAAPRFGRGGGVRIQQRLCRDTGTCSPCTLAPRSDRSAAASPRGTPRSDRFLIDLIALIARLGIVERRPTGSSMSHSVQRESHCGVASVALQPRLFLAILGMKNLFIFKESAFVACRRTHFRFSRERLARRCAGRSRHVRQAFPARTPFRRTWPDYATFRVNSFQAIRRLQL